MKRRTFFKALGVAGATACGLDRAQAGEAAATTDGYAVLVDTTRCIGCRNCETVCAEAHGFDVSDMHDADLERVRRTSEQRLTLVNRYDTDKGEVFVKRQCMHCLQPACAAACLTRALIKTAKGPVVWRESKCMGCRYCMVSCPFDAPVFEYDRAVPDIRKCDLCADRLAAGEAPRCVAECLGDALAFGPREELLLEARRRIAESPELYVPEIYGEEEVGGTSWLYLSSVPFDQIGFRTDLARHAYPEFTKEFLYGVPVVLTLVPAFLLALSNATKRDDTTAAMEDSDEERRALSDTAA